jgi:cation diffusion facilitator family transporter
MERRNLTYYAWLSIFAAVTTIGLKTAAYYFTGSVGLLSDALESVVNLVAAILALVMLTIASRPPDEDYAYGYSKAEYFSSGIEGTLILLAALSIMWTAVLRLMSPQPLEQVGLGLVISLLASLINLIVARILLKAGRSYHSITLEADGKHLMTDVWTSAGVIIGIGAVVMTGWLILDPLIAIGVAANITWAGFNLIKRSVLGLMDTAVPPEAQNAIRDVLEQYKRENEIEYHALRTRQAGARQFVTVHILVPGDWTVHQGHELLEQIEAHIRKVSPTAVVFTHLESLDDPASWLDVELDRTDSQNSPIRQLNN